MNANHSPSTLAPDRPRIGLIVVDDGLYTHRWAASVLDHVSIRPICAACLSPTQAVNFNPGGARGLWAVGRARLAYYGPVAAMRFGRKAAGAAIGGLRFRLGLGGAAAERGCGGPCASGRSPAALRQRHRRSRLRARLKGLRPDLLVLRVFPAGEWGFSGTAAARLPERPFLAAPRASRPRTSAARAACRPRGGRVGTLDGPRTGRRSDRPPVAAGRNRPPHAARAHPRGLRPGRPGCARRDRGAIAGPPAATGAGPLPPMTGWPSRAEVAQLKSQGFRFV